MENDKLNHIANTKEHTVSHNVLFSIKEKLKGQCYMCYTNISFQKKMYFCIIFPIYNILYINSWVFFLWFVFSWGGGVTFCLFIYLFIFLIA